MYTEESNQLFDETCYDCLYLQLHPLGHMLDSGEIKRSDVDEIQKLLKEVEQYYKATQKLVEPNWIYG